MNRQESEARGRWGERRAMLWLRLRGWRILGERIRHHHGEIDIVARRGKTLAFIEVKTRAKAEDLDHAIDTYRLRRVAAAANAVAARYAKPDDEIRIDVILIAPRHLPRHLINVWHG